MNPKFSGSRPVFAGLAALALSGCAQMEKFESASVLRCGAATLGGAVAGLAIGKATGSDHEGRDAALGAVAGALACVAYEYQSRQTQTAQDVERGYRTTAGALPTASQVTAYRAQLQPGAAIRAGSQTTLVSDFTLVAGSASPQPKVEEALELYAPNGEKVSSARKPVNSVAGSGSFQNQFKFRMPEGVPEGVYPISLTLYADGAPLSTTRAQLQIARHASGLLVAGVQSIAAEGELP